MKIAITGANGFLAGYVLQEVISSGNSCVLVTRKPGERFGIDFFMSDYSKNSLMDILKDSDAIVHLASTRKVYEGILDYKQELQITENLYAAAHALGIQNIIFASSISVYSGTDLPYTEKTIPNPAGVYGLSKLVCEQIGNQYSSKYGMKIKNFRFAHLYGANEDNNYMINRFFRQGYHHEQMTVHAQSIAKREFLYAKDAAKAVMVGLNQKELSGAFNIGSTEYLTNEEIAKIICSAMSPEMEVMLGSETETIESSYMDSSKMMNTLGYRPQYTLFSATKEIQNAMRKNV